MKSWGPVILVLASLSASNALGARNGPRAFGVIQNEMGSPPSNTPMISEQSNRNSGHGLNFEASKYYLPVEVPDLLPPVEIPQLGGSTPQRQNRNNNSADAPPAPRNLEAMRDSQIGNQKQAGDCSSGEPGKDISVYLPSDRDQVGKIVVSDPMGGAPISCNAKGKGIASMSENKGDTPIGEYTTLGFGGNTDEQWGQEGIQMKQSWNGQGSGGNQGRGFNQTDDLFIHTKDNLTEDEIANASSWGCVIVSKDCMDKITAALQNRNNAEGLKMVVKEGSCQ
ncbi:hypothetical protein GW915_10235 [bacterium]|nr:hypothetical protein [bacterium]